MVEIKVITYEESRLAYFREQRDRHRIRFDSFSKSRTVKEMPPEERHRMLSEMGEILQYYDEVVDMLEKALTEARQNDT